VVVVGGETPPLAGTKFPPPLKLNG
jgi:hypothetical protein